MTDEQLDKIKQDILAELRFDAALIEELTPVKTLNEGDMFELHGGRAIPWARVCSEFRVQATLDKYRHVDRGPWKDGEEYYASDTNPLTGLIEISHVWYFGCKFRCLVTGTNEPPSWDSEDWEFEEGDPSFKVWFTGGPAAVPVHSFAFTLTVNASKYNQDVTGDILPQDVVWTRYTEDRDGNPRVASDTIWATRRGGEGLSMALTEADIDADINGIPKVCVFTATVTLRDGTEATASLKV